MLQFISFNLKIISIYLTGNVWLAFCCWETISHNQFEMNDKWWFIVSNGVYNGNDDFITKIAISIDAISIFKCHRKCCCLWLRQCQRLTTDKSYFRFRFSIESFIQHHITPVCIQHVVKNGIQFMLIIHPNAGRQCNSNGNGTKFSQYRIHVTYTDFLLAASVQSANPLISLYKMRGTFDWNTYQPNGN